MFYALMCKDKPDSLELRMATRPTHVEYLTSRYEAGVLKMAGPLLGDDDKPIGSLLVVSTETKAEAEAFAANDPYAKAGLFASVEVRPFNWTFGKPEA